MDYLQAAKEEEKRLAGTLFARMDTDRDLIVVADRILKDAAETPKKIPNSVYVALNDLVVFVTMVESYLDEAEEQIVVTSEDKNLDTHEIEIIVKAI